MKKFSFRLESVLRYRQHLEKRAQGALFDARHECENVKKRIESLMQQKMETTTEWEDKGLEGINVATYQIYRSFLGGLSRDLERAHKDLDTANREVEMKEAALKDESIKKKTLETLKDQQTKKLMAETEKEEQNSLDEMVLLRRLRAR